MVASLTLRVVVTRIRRHRQRVRIHFCDGVMTWDRCFRDRWGDAKAPEGYVCGAKGDRKVDGSSSAPRGLMEAAPCDQIVRSPNRLEQAGS